MTGDSASTRWLAKPSVKARAASSRISSMASGVRRNSSLSASVYTSFSTGVIHWAVRWKSVSSSTSSTTAATICVADEPVPITPTRLPASETRWSQRAL